MLRTGPSGSHSLILTSKNGKWKSASTRISLEAVGENPFPGSVLLGMESQECAPQAPAVSCLFKAPSVVGLDSSQKSWKCCKGAPHGCG